MKRATLVVNPSTAGAARLREQWPALLSLLRMRGFEPVLVETTANRGSAEGLTKEAVARGVAVVFACGGDGTVHEVVQGLAQTGVALGVLPLGTANAFARNLDLSLDLKTALFRQSCRRPQLVPLGQIETASEKRWFCVMAGCGPDGELVHSLAQEDGLRLKRRFGRAAYYGRAGLLFLTRRSPGFRAEWRIDGRWDGCDAVAVMASRVPDLGGLFSGLTRRARLGDERLHLQIVRTPGWLSLPAWMAGARLEVGSPLVTNVDADEIRCTPIGRGTVYGQADAEPMGALPMTLRVVAGALLLLRPEGMR
jgi:diacylglycerol kinase family enzyme